MYRDFYKFLKEDNINYSNQLKIEDSPLKHEVVLTQQKILQLLSVLDKSITGISESIEDEAGNKEKAVQKTEPINKAKTDEKLLNSQKVTNRKVNLPNLYEFKRDIIGGRISGLNTLVPEETVRQQGLNHGDLVTAYSYNRNGKKEFAYLLEEKSENSEKGCRVQFNRCKVEETVSELICRATGQGLMKLNGELFNVTISPKDRQEYNLKDGDVIDIAVCKKNSSKVKVIWKHEKNDMKNTKKISKKRRSNKKKLAAPVPLTLEGKKIMIVSFEYERLKYEREIQKRGGELLMGDAHDTTLQLKNLTEKADLIILITTNSSHHAVKTVVKEAKVLGVPYITSESKGTTQIIKVAEQMVTVKL